MRLSGEVQERSQSHSQERSGTEVGHVVRAADHVTMRRCHAGPAGQHDLLGCASIALLSILAEHIESKSGLEDQAGRRVEGKWGPLWSAEERSGLQGKASMFEHRGERPHACAACGARTRTPGGYADGPDQRVAQRP